MLPSATSTYQSGGQVDHYQFGHPIGAALEGWQPAGEAGKQSLQGRFCFSSGDDQKETQRRHGLAIHHRW